MIDKKKLFKSLIIISLIIIIIVAIIQIRNTLAKYETDATADRDVDVAFWITDNSFKTARLLIEDIYPKDNTPLEYTFTVSNFESEDIAETDMEYEIVLTTTTNMPLSYTVQRNGVECTKTESLYTDSDGTVYRKIQLGTTENPFIIDTIDDETNQKRSITDSFTLQVTFPQQSNVNGVLVNNRADLDYPDLIEDIKIELTARQTIGE